MNPVILYRINPQKNMHRFYRLAIQQDLFGKWCFIREWGRIGRSGQSHAVPYETGLEAEKMLNNYLIIKQKKGYK